MIKGMPMQLNNMLTVAWDRQNFKKVSKVTNRCVMFDENQNSPVSIGAEVDTDANNGLACLCLDPASGDGSPDHPYHLKSSGSVQNPFTGGQPSPNTFMPSPGFVKTLDGTETYTPPTDPNNYGMPFTAGSFSGRVNLPFDSVYRLEGVKNQHYAKGSIISQAATGATGVVYKDTPTTLHGLQGQTVSFQGTITAAGVLTVISISGSGIIPLTTTFTGPNGYAESFFIRQQLTGTTNGVGTYQVYVSPEGTAYSTSTTFTLQYAFTQTSPQFMDLSKPTIDCGSLASPKSSSMVLFPGMKLSQNNDAAYGYVIGTGYVGQGIGVNMVTGTFSTASPITVTAGTADPSSVPPDSAGTLTFASGGLDATESVDMIIGGNGCPSFSGTYTILTFKSLTQNGHDDGNTVTITSVTGGTTDGHIFGYITPTGEKLAFIDSMGSSCTQTGTDGITISGTFDAAQTCTISFVVKCATRVDASDSNVIVRLTSTSKFLSGGSKPVTMTPANSNTATTITNPWYQGLYWVQAQAGDPQPITDATTVSYSVSTNIQASDSVPTELWCYDNCPVGDNSATVSSLTKKKSVKSLALIFVNTEGSCTAAQKENIGQHLTWVGFTTNPTLTFTWQSNSDVNGNTYYTLGGASIVDPGMPDLSEDSPTLTFNNGACTTVPTVTLSMNYNDYKDFRGVYKYSYDPMSGILIDKSNNFRAYINDPHASDGESYGIFFEPTAENKQALLCDWDPNSVCSYKAWQSLDEMYQYNTGGPYYLRVSLLDSKGNPRGFDPPLTLIYTHPDSSSNSKINYQNKNILLTYYDQGQLQGIPQLCMNPVTQVRSDCVVDFMAADATINIADIIMDSKTVLTDLSGNAYYARHQIETEYFPMATDPNLCAGLTFANLPSIPTMDKFYVAPKNAKATFPSDAELAAKFLNGGKPVVSKGVTSFEATGSK